MLVNRESLDETPDAGKDVFQVAGADGVWSRTPTTIADQLADFLDKPGAPTTPPSFSSPATASTSTRTIISSRPTAASQDPDKWKRSSLVEWGDIQKSVERAEGMRFMLLDTCHAANAFNPRLEKDAADARIVVFSATAANNTAAELPELGHGVFTYSVLEGLRGAAKTSDDGVTLFGLADYISAR